MPESIRVRMYNVGFGDAFLLFLPTDDGDRTMLLDCGVHPSGVTNSISDVAADIVQTVATDGAPRIDVVVATHRHADHIAGFGLKAWSDVDVGEVWLPWTEDRSDPAARRIRRAQNRLALALQEKAGRSAAVSWFAANALSNADAEATLLRGFAGSPERRYLPSRERGDRTFRTRVLPGVNVHALGPSHDRDVIATMSPPKGAYFPLRGANAGGVSIGAKPDELTPLFAEGYQVAPREYYRRHRHLSTNASREQIDELTEDDLELAASGLEDAINGTSLVLMLELGDRCILLGGDAEWGTWNEVLDDTEWCDLLARTDLYKVSHHGSYNGTPKSFVDDYLPDHALSLVSLRAMDRWPSIPRKSLLTALADGGRTLVRSDKLRRSRGVKLGAGGLWAEVELPLS
jgi:beta-lactamase superfamily II metal-dependent hydrolase